MQRLLAKGGLTRHCSRQAARDGDSNLQALRSRGLRGVDDASWMKSSGRLESWQRLRQCIKAYGYLYRNSWLTRGWSGTLLAVESVVGPLANTNSFPRARPRPLAQQKKIL